MLTRVHFKHFRCLVDVSAELRPLTVLIGPNDSGKSTFLNALSYMASRPGFQQHDHWQKREDLEISLSAKTDDGIEIILEGSSKGGKTSQKLIEFPSIDFFQLPSAGIPLRSPGIGDTDVIPQLGSDGSGVPTLIDYLLRRDRTAFDKLVQELRDRVPGVENIHVSTPSPGDRGIELVIEQGYRIPGERLSNGVRLVLFFLALRHHPKPPSVVLLEEPENGVHRSRLEDIMSLLRDMTDEHESGEQVQVLLTTHSPHLLDYVDLDRDQVLVFQRNDDGSCHAEPVDRKRMDAFLGEFMLGEVWYNSHEEGLVKRNV